MWYVWGTRDSNLWKAYNGTNWDGGNRLGSAYNSNIVVGDDGNGSLYFLDPEADQDDSSSVGSESPQNFLRKISLQYPMKGYSFVRCYGLELLGSIGETGDGVDTTVTLTYSDDRGNSYSADNVVTVAQDDLDSRVFWPSLGSMKSPGRVFQIKDYGALKRIDSVTMIAEGEGTT